MKGSKNYLLVKDDVGRSKPTTRSLPHEDFTFGVSKAIRNNGNWMKHDGSSVGDLHGYVDPR